MVTLPDIEAEGERLAADTWKHPSGMYLWTDLVGAIQTAIFEERQRHTVPAQGMGAGTAETGTGSGLQPASPVPQECAQGGPDASGN